MYRNYAVVIQAGGKGTRMRELTQDTIPKPMLKIDGKPMLQWQIENVAKFGMKEFIIVIGHLGEAVKDYFGDGSAYGVQISYIEEKMPLGSAGALYYLKKLIGNKDFLFLFGDVMFELAWDRMITFHEKHGGIATLLAHPNSHPHDSDLLIMEDNYEIIGIDSKNNVRNYWYKNCVNAGIYILSNRILDTVTELKRLDLEKDILAPRMGKGEVYGYVTPEYVKDAGTPERFRQVSREHTLGIWENKCLSHKQRCIFLDRDGTLNVHNGFISKAEDLELEDGVADAIRLFNQNNYLCIVITNQPVIARNLCTFEELEEIHKKLETLLGNEGAYLDDIFFCPHHPDSGYPNEWKEYKIECECRKPGIALIRKAVEKYNIDLEQSYLIGDSTVDIQTGINAGVTTVLLNTGERGRDGKFSCQPDRFYESLLQAAKEVTNEL